MKKIALSLSVLALSLGFTACDNYELPNPPAQSNPQEAPVGVEDIVISAVPAEEGAIAEIIDLKKYNDENKLVPLAVIDCANWPTSYDMVVSLYLKSMSYTTSAIPVTVQGNTLYAAADDIEAAILAKTKDPNVVDFIGSFAVAAKAGDNGTLINIGGADYRFGELDYIVKPYDADYTIEDTYYLVNGDNKIKLNHSDASPYDDPEFSVVVEITDDQAAAGYEWTLVSEAGIVYSGEGLEGDLVNGGTGVCTLGGPVMFTFNLEQLTFAINNAYEFVYTPGGSNGWNQAASNALTSSDYTNYAGWAYLDGEWKFCATLDWSKPFGLSSEEGKVSTDPTAGNLKADPAGVYYLTLNIISLDYTMTLMESCGVIGDATPNGWDAQTNLTQDAENPMIWTGKVNFNAGGEWKIRFNEDWTYNLGGEMGNLEEGGPNIATPGEGEHTVTVDLSSHPYVVTVE